MNDGGTSTAAGDGTGYATPLQQWLAAVWSDVLVVVPPVPTDNLIRSGGHSLHALRIAFLIREALGVPLPLITLLDVRDFQELTERLDALLAEHGKTPDFAALLAQRLGNGGGRPLAERGF